MAATLLPTVLLAWYLGDPAHNQPIVIRLEHFVITSNVSVVAALGRLAFVGLGWPAEFAGIARWILASGGAAAGYQPSSYGYGVPAGGDVTGGAGWIPFAIVAAVLVLYGYCAFAQGRDFIRTGLPLQGALAVAYVLLAQAQVSQFLGPIWTPRGGSTTASCSPRSFSRWAP